jgi:hypothetical protein
MASPPPCPPDLRALPDYQAVPYVHEFFAAVIDRIEHYMRSAEDSPGPPRSHAEQTFR